LAATPVQTTQETAPVLAAPSGGKVALLVPLSGKSAALGEAMANAAQLAVFDLGAGGFEILPRDTQGTPSGAAQAAREALASGARLLIGPLFAGDVVAVKPIVKASGVAMLSLSTDVSLAEENAFVLGFAPAPQVERVIALAAARGLKRFAAIEPSGAYGQIVMKAFAEAVEKNGGVVTARVAPSSVASLAAQKESFDALFIPFGGQSLKNIAAGLKTAGIDTTRVRLVGTGLWDEESLAKDMPVLRGGWFAAAPATAREKFEKAYQTTYQKTPPRLATLAYDATALAAVLARHGHDYGSASLTSAAGFAGLDGLFRLRPNGQVERGLAVLELTEDAHEVVDPAPATFSVF